MRKFRGKRFVAAAAATMLAMSMIGSSMTAMAATVHITDQDGMLGTNAKFTAYRVFAGTNSNGKLTNIVWGAGFEGLSTDRGLLGLVGADAGVTAEEVADFLVSKEAAVNEANAGKFAEIVRKYIDGNTVSGTEITNGSDLPDAGYYLIENSQMGDGGVKNLALMEVTSDGDINITVKVDKPSVDKKVWEERLENQTEDSTFAEGDLASGQWNDVADYDIGDEIPFKLTATIPAGTTTPYETYAIKFEDNYDANLAVDKESFHVYYSVGEAEAVKYEGAYAKEDKENGFTLQIDNVKELLGENTDQELKVYVTFTAKLTGNAQAGAGEENKVKLHFSNDYTGDGTPNGVTEEDTVVALTFGMDVNKYTGDIESNLADAVFKLYKVPAGTAIEKDALKTVKKEDGSYDLATEVVEKLEAVKLTGEGEAYTVDAVNGTDTFKTTDKGDINIKGLDRDTYILVETTAPAGYNILTNGIEIKLTNTTEYNRDSYTTGDHKKVEFTVNEKDSHIVDVENKSGSMLPETGGIGTTIFYIAGTLLMACAVYVVTAKGRRKEERE